MLDTNIVIAMLRGEPSVVDRAEAKDEFYVSSTIAGELFYGAFNSANIDENIQRISFFLTAAVVLPCDETTSRFYGEIKSLLRRSGRPIPDNDIWIAASTMQHSLTLVTRDVHFNEVEGLRSVRW
jgi:tRNA(fMet)-specific endonuclease VapC